MLYVNPPEERNGNLVTGRVVDRNTRPTSKKQNCGLYCISLRITLKNNNYPKTLKIGDNQETVQLQIR